MQEKVFQTKICTLCGNNFDITEEEIDFYDKMSPVFNWVKFDISTPTFCHECKFKRRLSWKNLRNLYKRKCDATWKQIISMYSPDKNYVIYNLDFWWSDKWDVMDYYLNIDFDKSFFDQFKELLNIVPKRPLVKWTWTENCDYTNCIWASKDSYLIFDSINSEHCYYSTWLIWCNNCFDCTLSRNCEYSYMLYNCIGCYNSSYLIHSNNCSKSSYLYNCNNCNDCFWCVNLNNKSYCIFNIEYTKEEYNNKLEEVKNKWFSIEEFNKMILYFPVINLNIINSENVNWDNICNAKNVVNSFDVYDAENISNSFFVHSWTVDCLDWDVVLNNSSKVYDCSLLNKICTNILFSYDVWNNCENLIYCTECKRTKNSFMCTGLVWKEYCIFNKQYMKEEYEELVPKIIEKMKKTWEWWEFFPWSISMFGYNESYAQEFFPLIKKEALSKWFNWSDYTPELPQVEKIIPASKLPTNISDIPDDILNWAIECEVTKKPFRILAQELEFYRKNNIPIPKRHSEQRHLERMAFRNDRKLRNIKCDKCKKEIKTTYKEWKIIYCEECYNKEVY